MNLSTVFRSVQNALMITGWQPVIEDDYPDLKQLVCENKSGPLEVFTRLDVLIMTPELNPANTAGVCLCFLFYADPSEVVDMRKLGKTIRQDDFQLFQSLCETILNAADIFPANPSINLLTRPKREKIRFRDGNISYPAFLVELDYWISSQNKTISLMVNVEGVRK